MPSPQYGAIVHDGPHAFVAPPYVVALVPSSHVSVGLCVVPSPQRGPRVHVAVQWPYPLPFCPVGTLGGAPSSHCSLPTTLPSPQIETQLEIAWTKPLSVSL